MSAKLAFLTIVFQWNLTQIFPGKSRKICGSFSEFVPKIPMKFDLFSAAYHRPCVMNGLRNNSP